MTGSGTPATDVHERPPTAPHKPTGQRDSGGSRWTPVDPLAEVDGNPRRVAFPQRVGLEEHQFDQLRVTLRVTA
jgi:hypothetical protein